MPPLERALPSADNQVTFISCGAEVNELSGVLIAAGRKFAFQIFGNVCEVSEARRKHDAVGIDDLAIERCGNKMIGAVEALHIDLVWLNVLLLLKPFGVGEVKLE